MSARVAVAEWGHCERNEAILSFERSKNYLLCHSDPPLAEKDLSP